MAQPGATPPPVLTTHPDVRPFRFTASDEAHADLLAAFPYLGPPHNGSR